MNNAIRDIALVGIWFALVAISLRLWVMQEVLEQLVK